MVLGTFNFRVSDNFASTKGKKERNKIILPQWKKRVPVVRENSIVDSFASLISNVKLGGEREREKQVFSRYILFIFAVRDV